ncbi:MAG TPA: Spy/CpxP family protein refolding chaperone [Myxococcaceae bacterium]|nr:Spy/CpxP family protein refolding chaperone [Myxococcaceae bacterium]
MKRTAVVGIAVLAVAAVTGVAAAAAQRAHRDPKQVHDFINRKVDRLMDQINATDTQRTQINQLKEKLFSEGMDLRNSQRTLRRDLLADWDAPQVNADDVHARVDKQVEAFRAFAHDAANASIQLHDILTPEQRAQLKKELGSHMGHARGMHEDAQE